MKRLLSKVLLVLFVGAMFQTTFAASDTINIAAKTNIGSVGYWFTDAAALNAKKEGSDINGAIRQIPFPLIMSMANVAKKTKGFQAYVVDKIDTSGSVSLILQGVVIGGELYILVEDVNKKVVKKFVDNMKSNSIKVDGNQISVM